MLHSRQELACMVGNQLYLHGNVNVSRPNVRVQMRMCGSTGQYATLYRICRRAQREPRESSIIFYIRFSKNVARNLKKRLWLKYRYRYPKLQYRHHTFLWGVVMHAQ